MSIPYVIVIQTALGIAKQIQQDHPEMPGADKFGMLVDLLVAVFGEQDVSKWKPAIQLVVTLAVEAWKIAGQHGFFKKPAATPATT